MSVKITEESILELARGFMASRVLLSGAELDLFTVLAEEACSGPCRAVSPAITTP